MQRNFDLVVSILGAFRDAPTAALNGRSIAAAVQELDIDDAAAADVVGHHLELLADAGLAKKLTEGNNGDAMWRITWKGYDALEQDEEDDDDLDLDD